MEKANKSNNYHYNKKLQAYARENKKKLNRSATTMWSLLKGGQIRGYKIRRERPILNYIVDFCCLELMLVIEVDGLSHHDPDVIKKDKIRDKAVESIGFTVLRYDSLYVLEHSDSVEKDITFWIKEILEGTQE